MSRYLHRVRSRTAAAPSPNVVRPVASRRWTSAPEPFGIAPPIDNPSTPQAIPAGDTQAPTAGAGPRLPATPAIKHLASPTRTDSPGQFEPAVPTPTSRQAPQPQRPYPSASEVRTSQTVEYVAAQHTPTNTAENPPTAATTRSDRDGSLIEAAPVADQRPLTWPPLRPTITDSRADSDGNRTHLRPQLTEVLAPPITPSTPASPPPTPQRPQIVIGRISVVVESPRSQPAQVSPPSARRASVAVARTAPGPRFTSRFGIGQL